MTPVRIEYAADDYVAALKLHALWSRRRLLVFVSVGVVAAVLLFTSAPTWPSIIAGGVLGGVIGGLSCYALGWLFYLPWKARRMFRQQKSLQEVYEVDWNDEGLSVRGQRVQGVTPWRDYLKKKENAQLVLLYHSDVLFQMLPRRQFTAEQWQSLRSHLDRVGRAM